MGNLCCIQVDESTVAIKERFGKFEEVLEPGCHFLPWILGYQRAGNLSLRLQQLDVNCKAKTKDNVFINVVAFVQYRALADKAYDAFYKLSDVRSRIQTNVIHVIRAGVAKLNLGDAYERKNEIDKAVKDELGKAMSDYGYEIVKTLIVGIELGGLVKLVMNEEYAANMKAEGEMFRQIMRAEGDAELKYLSGLVSVLGFSENNMSAVPSSLARKKYFPEESRKKYFPEESRMKYFPEDSRRKYFPEDSRMKYFPEDSRRKYFPEDSRMKYFPEDSRMKYFPEES